MFQVETWWSVISLAYPLSSFSFYRYNNECSGVKKRGRCIAIYWWVCVLHNPADLTKSSNIKVHRSLWCTDLNLTASQSHEKPHLDWFKTAQHRIGEQFTVFYFMMDSAMKHTDAPATTNKLQVKRWWGKKKPNYFIVVLWANVEEQTQTRKPLYTS